MFGKGKMYKDKKVEDPVTTLPFGDNESLYEEELLFPTREQSEIHPPHKLQENSSTSCEFENSDETPKVIEKQRNVKKIIILFDDGTFQEM